MTMAVSDFHGLLGMGQFANLCVKVFVAVQTGRG